MRKFRVLSLDGGGCWSLIQVKALIDIFGADRRGHEILSQFDVVAANSGGSIVLGCLLEDMTLTDVLALFYSPTWRTGMFSPTDSNVYWALSWLTGTTPKYSADHKLSEIRKALVKTGGLSLPEAVRSIPSYSSADPIHVLIVTFDYDGHCAKFFRSARIDKAHWGVGRAADGTLSEIIHASSNAPVSYFDGPACFADLSQRYWDGAISGCNNPVLAATAEALGLKGLDVSTIAALSIGTGSVVFPKARPGTSPSPFEQRPSATGFLNDLRKLASSILDDPPEIASFLAHLLTGGGLGIAGPDADSRIVRLSPMISPVDHGSGWCCPGNLTFADFQYLMNIPLDALQQSQIDAIANYADLWLAGHAPNQPIRKNSFTLQPELGHIVYSRATRAWLSIS
jgi:hypothetical protein